MNAAAPTNTAAAAAPRPSAVLRPADERGATDIGWLDSRHGFSFGGYRDPRHMGFGPLRVLNDDRVAPGGGFGAHPHRDMEILSWVVEGGLSHQDSTGGGSTLRPGTAQLMSAGTGVTHSEFNASHDEPVRFLQVWIEPDAAGYPPRYAELPIDPADRRGQFAPIAAPEADGAAKRLGAMPIRQDASVWVADLDAGESVRHDLAPGRRAWVQIVTGTVTVNGQALREGDGLALSGVEAIDFAEGQAAQVLLFDLAG